MEETRVMRAVSVIAVILGALSFLSLLDEPWRLAGLICGAAAVILGRTGRKSPVRTKQLLSYAAILLGGTGALIFLIVSFIHGVRIPHTL